MASLSQNQPIAFLFDLDGTLVDSLPDLAWAMNRLLDEIGRPPVALEDVRRWVGDGASTLVERCLEATGGLPKRPLGEAVSSFLAHYRGHAAVDSRVYPGVVGTLAGLAAAGHPLGVCTNKPTDLSLIVLSELGLDKFFSAVVGGDGVARRKPHPDHILATLTAMGVSGREALMVGDSRNDVIAARAAGIPVVVVRFGYAQGAPEALGGDLVIDRYEDLPAAAAKLCEVSGTFHRK
jgi:phosphoglycolate phosphatase